MYTALLSGKTLFLMTRSRFYALAEKAVLFRHAAGGRSERSIKKAPSRMVIPSKDESLPLPCYHLASPAPRGADLCGYCHTLTL